MSSYKDITEWLMTLDNEQLDRVQEVLQKKVQEKLEKQKKEAERKLSLAKRPPNYTSKIEELAELQGLDLSGLMREISRR